MSSKEKNINFNELTYEKFRELAQSKNLSRHEKVGFPDNYRDGKESQIFSDIISKVSPLNDKKKIVLEIGPGCSLLPVMLADFCKAHEHELHFVDSPEMLALLPDGSHIHKWPGRYPEEVSTLITQLKGKVDAIIAYSVIQYVFVEGNLWTFIDSTLSLLTLGGEILLGDIPNITMRKRFFSSPTGIKYHREFTGRDDLPEVRFNQLELGHIDDSVVLAILSRARAQGFHAWILPQAEGLPMANRREDILIRKP
ncbi:SAM-dependent methyltransferase [Hydrogenophilus hirschii]